MPQKYGKSNLNGQEISANWMRKSRAFSKIARAVSQVQYIFVISNDEQLFDGSCIMTLDGKKGNIFSSFNDFKL